LGGKQRVFDRTINFGLFLLSDLEHFSIILDHTRNELKSLAHSLGWKMSTRLPMGLHRPLTVRSPNFLSMALRRGSLFQSD
jgi:hypothetical protein